MLEFSAAEINEMLALYNDAQAYGRDDGERADNFMSYVIGLIREKLKRKLIDGM